MEEVKLMKTKNGNGFKVFVDSEWFYTNSREVERFFNGEIPVVTFRKIEEKGEKETKQITKLP